MRKQTPLAILGILVTLVLALNVVSAASLTITDVTAPASVLDTATSFDVTFNLNNSGTTDTDLNWTFNATEGTITTISFSEDYINASESLAITATVTIPASQSGNVAADVTAGIINGSGSDKTFNFSVPIVAAPITGCMDVNATNYNSNATVAGTCTYAEEPLSFACPATSDDNDIDYGDVEDDSDVEDEWNWRPLEDIVLLIEDLLHTIGDDGDDAELIVEWYFVDSDGNEVRNDVVDDVDDLEDDVNLDSDEDEEDMEFNFKIEGDVENGVYDLYLKVYEDGNEDEHCSLELVEEVDIDRKSREVIVKEVDGPETVKAGESVTFEVEVANLGTNDEDKVRIIAYNSILGIRQTKTIDDLDEGDDETVTMVVQIPEDADEGEHRLIFSTEYDYDDDDEDYDEESDSDDDIAFEFTVLEGASSAPLIGARLISDAELGETVEVEIAIQNPGKDATFYLMVEGTDGWAEELTIGDNSLSVDEDDTESTIISFVPTETGNQKFTVVVEYDGKTAEQDVSVNIGEKTGILTGAFAGLGLGTWGSALVWAIVILAIVILVVLIIKLATPRRRVVQREY